MAQRAHNNTPENIGRWPKSKYFGFAAAISLASIVLSLIAAEYILQYFDNKIKRSEVMDPGLILYDATLGWRLKPGWHGRHKHHDFDTSYRINDAGFRISTPKRGATVTAVLGDSFTFGIGAANRQTFTSRLNQLDKLNSQFINMGVPGYSTDQQYLLLKQTIKKINPDRILLVVYLANDLFDNLLAYPMQAEHAKPLFKLEQNRLVLSNTPVPLITKPASAANQNLSRIVMGEKGIPQSRLAQTFGHWHLAQHLGIFQSTPHIGDSFFQARFDTALTIFNKLLQKLHALSDAHNARLFVALLPGHSYISQPGGLSAQYQEYLRKRIVKNITANKQADSLIDIAQAMRQHALADHSQNWYFPNEGHLSADGHKLVSEIIKETLINSE